MARTCRAGGLGREDGGAGRAAHGIAGVTQHRAALAAGHLVALRRAAAGIAAAERAAIVAASAARAWAQLTRLLCVHLGRERQAKEINKYLSSSDSVMGHGMPSRAMRAQAVSTVFQQSIDRGTGIQAAHPHTFLSSLICVPSPEATAAGFVVLGFSVTIEVRSMAVLIRVLRRRRFHVAVGICRARIGRRHVAFAQL